MRSCYSNWGPGRCRMEHLNHFKPLHSPSYSVPFFSRDRRDVCVSLGQRLLIYLKEMWKYPLRGNAVNRSNDPKVKKKWRKKMNEWYFCHNNPHDNFFCTYQTKPTGRRVLLYAYGTFRANAFKCGSRTIVVWSPGISYGMQEVVFIMQHYFAYGGWNSVPASLNKHVNDYRGNSWNMTEGAKNRFSKFENVLEIYPREVPPSCRF